MMSFWVQFHFPLGKNVRMPRPLAEKFDADNITKVEIYTTDGRLWLIALERENNEIWLGPGWTEFKKHYNIEYRDSLYFMHQVNNVFELVIFGLTGLEKNCEDAKKYNCPVYFFKKLTTRSSCAKLVLPDAFSSRFGKYFHNSMTLVGSNRVGQNKVTWSANDNMDKMMLLDGWGSFVDHLNIQRNDLVILKFNWTAALRVVVLPHDSPWIDHFHTGTYVDPRDIYNEVRVLFSVTLSENSARKGKPLFVPASVRTGELRWKPDIVPVRLETGELQEWTLIWPPGKPECKFGKGWYEFKKENDLKLGDVVTFGRRGMEPYLEVFLG